MYEKTHNIVLYNDPIHSLEHVVEVLMFCIPNMTKETAIKHGNMIHLNTRSIIFSGMSEHAEHFIHMIRTHEKEERNGTILPPLTVELEENKR